MDIVAFHEKTEHIIRVTFRGREGETLLALNAIQKENVLHGVCLHEL